MSKKLSITDALSFADRKAEIWFLTEKNPCLTGHVIGDAFVTKVHWHDGTRIPCIENEFCHGCKKGIPAKTQFAVHFVTVDTIPHAQILELSRAAFVKLAVFVKDYYGLNVVLKISRAKEKQFTIYEVDYVRNLTQEEKEEIKQLTFPDFEEAYAVFNANLKGGEL